MECLFKLEIILWFRRFYLKILFFIMWYFSIFCSLVLFVFNVCRLLLGILLKVVLEGVSNVNGFVKYFEMIIIIVLLIFVDLMKIIVLKIGKFVDNDFFYIMSNEKCGLYCGLM